MSGYQAIEFENTRVAYEPQETRRDRTPGDYPIPQSPFKSPVAIAEAMHELTDQLWTLDIAHFGGRGERICLVSDDKEPRLITLWRDAYGGYHPERKVGANWLPDLDLLDRLIEPHRFDHERTSGNHTEDEVADMRHPTW